MASDQVLVVGAGFAGSVCAERLASSGQRAVVVDRREHIGGNSFDNYDDHGVLVHPYGPHIFHTDDEGVFRYLSRFTDWRLYEHRVLAEVAGKHYPIPINRTTLNLVYGTHLETADEAAELLRCLRLPRKEIRTSEDVALAAVGPSLTDMFFRGYTRKQWGVGLEALSPSVVRRIPTRTDDDDRYFTDRWQFMPAAGYGTLFGRMLDHPLIEVRLGVRDARQWVEDDNWKHVIWTGPIDEYFGHALGRLPYRSLRFEFRHDPLAADPVQPVGTINYPSLDVPYTRTTEFRHLTGQRRQGTTFCTEHPQAEGDPFYPVPTEESRALYQRYRELAEGVRRTTFVGRLGTYSYLNMDQSVRQALNAVERLRIR